MEALQFAEAEAVSRYYETAQLAKERLESCRRSENPSEAAAKLSWISCMLLSTGEEVFKAKAGVERANAQQMADGLRRWELSSDEARREAAEAVAERDRLKEQLASTVSKQRREQIDAKNKIGRESARAVALEQQLAQLQANLKLSESAWVEKRRAEQAAATQREVRAARCIARPAHLAQCTPHPPTPTHPPTHTHHPSLHPSVPPPC